jgi:hypothetical protein
VRNAHAVWHSLEIAGRSVAAPAVAGFIGGWGSVRAWLKDRPWVVAAAALAAGVPTVIVAALVLAVASMWFIQTRFMPENAPMTPWFWAVVAGAICVAEWFLVRACTRVGGWRTLLLGVGGIAAVAVSFNVRGWAEAAMQPDNRMAGVGAGILAAACGLFAVVGAAMGGAGILLDRRKRPMTGYPYEQERERSASATPSSILAGEMAGLHAETKELS